MEVRDACAVDFDRHDWRDASEKEPEYHRSLFRGIEGNSVLTGKNIYIQRNGLPAKKVGRVFPSFLCAHKAPDGNVRAEVTVEWGGKDGTKVDYSVRGEVHDDKGQIEMKVDIDNDGQGKFTASGEISSEEKK